MTYTAQSCREEAAINDKFGDPIMNDPDLLRAYADALETIAKLKAHAEAMAERLDAWARIDECKCSDVDAYRRDFPKDEK
jgi:hypothetical protein